MADEKPWTTPGLDDEHRARVARARSMQMLLLREGNPGEPIVEALAAARRDALEAACGRMCGACRSRGERLVRGPGGSWEHAWLGEGDLPNEPCHASAIRHMMDEEGTIPVDNPVDHGWTAALGGNLRADGVAP